MNMGFVTIKTMVLPNSVNENNLFPWQLINSSRARVNKVFLALNTAKCGTEDVATTTTGHGLTETQWHEAANLFTGAI